MKPLRTGERCCDLERTKLEDGVGWDGSTKNTQVVGSLRMYAELVQHDRAFLMPQTHPTLNIQLAASTRAPTRRWRERLEEHGYDGLADRRGRRGGLPEEMAGLI